MTAPLVVLFDLGDTLVANYRRGDCGWRKPAPQPFFAALAHFEARPEECIFVGDDPRWDVSGAVECGLEAVLLDRYGGHPDFAGRRLTTLEGLLA